MSDVEILNRYSTADVVKRLDGAEVKLTRGEAKRKDCQTFGLPVSTKMLLRVNCSETGSSLVIELKNAYLHVAEVNIYGLGELKN